LYVYLEDVKFSRSVVVVALLGLVILTVVYWMLWFSDRALVASESTVSYYNFENAFPLADGLLAVAVLATAWCLWRRRSEALLFGLLAAGGGYYLFSMDVLFDLEHGIWFKGTGGGIELVINLITVGATTWLTLWLWRHRSLAFRGTETPNEAGSLDA
jgi:hypothetical protein